MRIINDRRNRNIRLTYEREEHINYVHPEMKGQYVKIEDALNDHLTIIKSRTDQNVNLYYKHYRNTP